MMAPNENAVGAPMCSPDAVGAPPRSPDAAAAAPRAAPPPAWEARLARDVAALGGDLGLILGPCGCGKSRLLRRLARVVPLGPGDWAEDRSVVSQMGATPELATGRLHSTSLRADERLPHFQPSPGTRPPGARFVPDGISEVEVCRRSAPRSLAARGAGRRAPRAPALTAAAAAACCAGGRRRLAERCAGGARGGQAADLADRWASDRWAGSGAAVNAVRVCHLVPLVLPVLRSHSNHEKKRQGAHAHRFCAAENERRS